jgi:hypothetical protein
MTRPVLALMCFVTAIVLPANAGAQSEPAVEKSDVVWSMSDLAAWQARLRTNFNDSKDALHRQAQRAAASPRAEDRERAKLLQQALEKANDEAIDKGFEKLIALLKTTKSDDRANVAKAITEMEEQGKRLHAILALLSRRPILMIDGSEDHPSGAHKDGYYLKVLFVDCGKRGYRIVDKKGEDLDTLDLTVDRFSCVYLLDMPSLSEKAAKRLESYVDQGGQAAIFLGDHVKPKVYNKLLYADGKGIFPVPLEEKPPERIDVETKFKRLFEEQPQIHFRDDQHPIFEDVADPKVKEPFKFLSIEEYWPAQNRLKWKADPTKVHELVTLPNRGTADSYRATINEIRDKLAATFKDEKFDKFQPALERYQKKIDAAIGEGTLYPLASAFDLLLSERGDPRNPEKSPDLKHFWDKNEALRAKIAGLRDATMYGDPLVLTKTFGKGRTVVFLTTAGKNWNDWAGGGLASPTYPVIMLNLQKYLTSAGEDKVIDDLQNIEAGEDMQTEILRRIGRERKDADPDK